MRNKILKLAFTFLLTFFVSGLATGQNTMSPYSSFGYGLLRDNVTSTQRQMGGIGYAMSSGRQINAMNPASYSSIDSLTFLFDIGADASFIRRSEGSESHSEFGGGLDYVTMQFPVSKRIGMSIGLVPFSSVGYSFGTEVDNGSSQRSGDGGLSQLYVGISGNIFKGFSVGANVAYLFGNITNSIYGITPSSTSVFEQIFEVRDWNLQIGAQYNFAISRKESIGIGVVYSPSKDLLGEGRVVKYALAGSSNMASIDTVASMKLNKNFSLPSTYGAGVSYRKGNNIFAELDLTYEPWGKAKVTQMSDFPATTFINRYKLALGGYWKPKDRGTYAESITYRAGFSFTRDYVMVGSNQVRDWTISCGVGLPTASTKTIINVGLEYKHRQAHPTPLLKENYLSLTVGINFNELWFFKRKID